MSFSPTSRDVSHSPGISSRIKSPIPDDAVAIDVEAGASEEDEDTSTITPLKHAGHSHSHSTDGRDHNRSHSHSHDHGNGHDHDHGHSHSHDPTQEAEETLAASGYSHGGHGHSHGGNMNMHALLLHVLGDALGNVGVISSGLIIWLTNWKGKYYSDPIISLVITCIIFTSALPLGAFAYPSFHLSRLEH